MKRLLCLSLLPLLAWGNSGVFDGSSANMWVINPDTGEVTGVNQGDWLDAFPGPAVADPRQALINQLPASSVPMLTGQPAVSLAGLRSSDADPNPAVAKMLPAEGAYSGTLEVFFGVRLDVLKDEGAVLSWTVNSERPGSLSLPKLKTAAACRALPRQRDGGDFQPACVARDGYVGARIALVEAGINNVAVNVSRPAGGAALASLNHSYTLSIDNPQRDTDGDSLPDAIEVAIGLDPLNPDLDFDRDQDGWSDLDEWLRCPTALDAESGCPANDDPDSEPLDADSDGWSDVDENLRGTRPDDPEPNLSPRAGEVPEDDNLALRRLRYKHVPAAQRLYEVEYTLDAALNVKPGLTGRWDDVWALAGDGELLWQLNDLLDQSALDEASLTANQLASSLLRSEADAQLANSRVPVMRVPASRGAVVAVQRRLPPASFPAPLDTPVVLVPHKRLLEEKADAGIPQFMASDPVWSTPQDWRAAALQWLQENLVVAANQTLDWPATREVAVIERMLSLEAELLQSPTPALYRPQVKSLPAFASLQQALREASDPQDPLSLAANGALGKLLARVRSALQGGGVLGDIPAFVDAGLDQTQPGESSDVVIARRFQRSYSATGCFVLSLYEAERSADPDFQSRCPQYYTEQDVLAWQREDASRDHRLRLLGVVPADVLAAQPSLLQAQADTDDDGLSNSGEISLRPLALATRPDVADTDDDLSSDLTDRCPLDPLNACLGFANVPRLSIGPQVDVVEGQGGGLALISLQLDRPAPRNVTFTVEVTAQGDDTATPNDDFQPFAERIRIAAGEQFAIVAVPIVADDEDEGAETFSLLLSDPTDVLLPAAGIQLAINDAAPVGDAPTAVAQAPVSVDERSSFPLNGGNSDDPNGAGLNYAWQQITGPAGILSDANNAVATFSAPEVLSPQTVEFRLTVTAGDGQQSSASASTQIQPVEDSPEVLSPLVLAVTQGDTVTSLEADILSHLREPDGQAMSVDAIVDAPLLGGRADVTNGDLSFAAFAGESQIDARQSRALRRNGPQHVAFIATGASGGGEPFDVKRFGPQGLQTLFTTSPDESISDLIGDNRNTTLYFDRPATATDPSNLLYQYRPDQGLRQVAGYAGNSLFAAAMESSSGDLYYCEEVSAGDGQWVRVDAATAQVQATGTACQGAFGIQSVQRGDRLCASEFGALHCADGSGGFELQHTFSEDIAQMYALDEAVLVFINSFASGTRQVWVLDGSGQVTKLADYERIGSYSAAVQLDNGLLVFPRVLNVGQPDESLQLMAWDGSGAPQAASDVIDAEASSFESARAGQLVARGNKVYWYHAGGDNVFLLRQLSVDNPLPLTPPFPSVVTPVSTSVNDTPGQIDLAPDGVYVGRSGSSEGFCDFLQIRDNGQQNVLVSAANCFQRQHIGSLVFQRFDSANFENTYYNYDGMPATGLLQFDLAVSDTQSNSVRLPVEITVSAP